MTGELPRLSDRFELGDEIGRGGFGAVFRARRRADGMAAAVKLAHGWEGGERHRVLREAELLAGVEHPRLARFLGLYAADDGAPALAYELVPGSPLPAVLHPPVPELARVVAWVGELAGGVEALHGAGLVHRDLKPGNIHLEPSGSVRILDYGLARTIEDGSTVTQVGLLVGTPGFLAPEAFSRKVTGPELDLYALAATAYWLIAGRAPFDGPDPGSVLAAQSGRPPPLPERPGLSRQAADAWFAAGLSPDPRQRPTSARDLAEGFLAMTERRSPVGSGSASGRTGRILDPGHPGASLPTPGATATGLPPAASPARPGPAAPAGPASRRRHVPVMAAALLGLMVVFAGYRVRSEDPGPAAEPVEPITSGNPEGGPVEPASEAGNRTARALEESLAELQAFLDQHRDRPDRSWHASDNWRSAIARLRRPEVVPAFARLVRAFEAWITDRLSRGRGEEAFEDPRSRDLLASASGMMLAVVSTAVDMTRRLQESERVPMDDLPTRLVALGEMQGNGTRIVQELRNLDASLLMAHERWPMALELPLLELMAHAVRSFALWDREEQRPAGVMRVVGAIERVLAAPPLAAPGPDRRLLPPSRALVELSRGSVLDCAIRTGLAARLLARLAACGDWRAEALDFSTAMESLGEIVSVALDRCPRAVTAEHDRHLAETIRLLDECFPTLAVHHPEPWAPRFLQVRAESVIRFMDPAEAPAESPLPLAREQARRLQSRLPPR